MRLRNDEGKHHTPQTQAESTTYDFLSECASVLIHQLVLNLAWLSQLCCTFRRRESCSRLCSKRIDMFRLVFMLVTSLAPFGIFSHAIVSVSMSMEVEFPRSSRGVPRINRRQTNIVWAHTRSSENTSTTHTAHEIRRKRVPLTKTNRQRVLAGLSTSNNVCCPPHLLLCVRGWCTYPDPSSRS